MLLNQHADSVIRIDHQRGIAVNTRPCVRSRHPLLVLLLVLAKCKSTMSDGSIDALWIPESSNGYGAEENLCELKLTIELPVQLPDSYLKISSHR